VALSSALYPSLFSLPKSAVRLISAITSISW
jgi:hypothetical protein